MQVSLRWTQFDSRKTLAAESRAHYKHKKLRLNCLGRLGRKPSSPFADHAWQQLDKSQASHSRLSILPP